MGFATLGDRLLTSIVQPFNLGSLFFVRSWMIDNASWREASSSANSLPTSRMSYPWLLRTANLYKAMNVNEVPPTLVPGVADIGDLLGGFPLYRLVSPAMERSAAWLVSSTCSAQSAQHAAGRVGITSRAWSPSSGLTDWLSDRTADCPQGATPASRERAARLCRTWWICGERLSVAEHSGALKG